MIRKLIWNDIKQNKLLSVVTTIFMAVSAMLLSLTVLLFVNLLSSIDDLMQQAKTPDFLQMHTGEWDEKEMAQFVQEHTEVKEWQICRFLNLENGTIRLGDYSLADSTQDNGLCVQGEQFDYLLDMENKLPEVLQGEVYVPVCYRARYNLNIGDIMQIGSHEFVIAGFVRDAQMNSMMASSKRFLIHEADYQAIKEQGEEEYLIEFLLQDGTDVNAFITAYEAEGLPANGPAITKPLIRMMNALSDGMVILVIFIVSIVVLLISLLCIRFILLMRMEKDKKEVGMLKALGIGNREIRRLYLAKYILLSVCGATLGLLMAYLILNPLTKQMQELYGGSKSIWLTGSISLLTVFLAEGLILLSIRHSLKKAEKISALEALFSTQKQKRNHAWGQYLLIGFVVAAGTFLMLVPQNLYSTLASPKFVTYMGIGDGEIRIDVRQTEDIEMVTEQIVSELEKDTRIEKYTVLQTRSYPAFLSDGTICNLMTEMGNHTVFPVSYVEGRAPEKETELALSTLYAKELGLSVGDSLQLLIGGRKITYTICGVYSDITNGGKTAKACNMEECVKDDTPVMWSILYITLKESVSREQWMEEYNHAGVDAVDIADYVKETYGQTLEEISLAVKVATGIAVLIIFVVVLLFVRLIVERNRYSISLQKAMGFTNGSIKKIYMMKGFLPAVAGVVTGLLTGNICGEGICGIILKSFGADGFQFVIAWEMVFILIPAVALMAAGIAVWIGILEIKNVKAFECCMGKE